MFHISNKEKGLQINEAIREREVRLVGENGEQLGVYPTFKAINLASEKNLDLVKVADKATPPVCKMMDYGKYKFELAKKDKESKKKSKTQELKEIRLSVNIGSHDMETKAEHAKKFLESGSKVKVSLRFKGREMARPDIGKSIMVKFSKLCEEFSVIEKTPSLDNRNMFMFLAPTKIQKSK